MHLYLRLVNESGESVIEQVPEEDFQSGEVGSNIGGNSKVTDNPNTADKPQSIKPFPCVLQILLT